MTRTDTAAVEQRAVTQTSNSVLGMLLFVISEAMFFMGFYAVYFSAYASATVWPPQAIPIPGLGLPTVAVIVLLVSATTMGLANRAGRRHDNRSVVVGMAATLALAVAFTILLLLSYRGLGFHNSTGIYGSLFWSLSIIALAHVIGGIVFFVMVLTQAVAGELELRQDPLQAATIYWNFVVAVGVALYVTFYLANLGAS